MGGVIICMCVVDAIQGAVWNRIAQEKAIVTVLPALHHHGKEGYKHCNDQVIYSLVDGLFVYL
jgi:uncharacterized protein YehS (DUF1456 family)